MILYRGGKRLVAKRIIDVLPRGDLFIDVFGGAANVAIAAVASGKYAQVVYNDLDDYIVEFLEVVRDDTQALVEYLSMTPMHPGLESKLAGMFESNSKIERAAGVFLATNFQYAPVARPNMGWRKLRIRRRNCCDRGDKSMEKMVQKLEDYAHFLLPMYFENQDAMAILRRYCALNLAECKPHLFDSGDVDVVVFLDPPYGETQDYGAQFAQWDELIEFYQRADMTVALCGTVGQHEGLDGEYVPLVDKNGTPTGSTAKEFSQGMWVKYRENSDNKLF